MLESRLIVLEVTVVNLTGAAIGVLLAARLLPVLLTIDPAATRALGIVQIDWRVGVYSLVSALVAAGIASALPAIRAASGRLVGVRSSDTLRSVLVGAQVALCLVLLVSGGLLLRALSRSTAISPGFDPDHVLTAQLRLPADRYSTPESRTLVMDQILSRLRAVPGVTGASQTLNNFTPGQNIVTLVEIDGRPTPDGSPHTVGFRRVAPGYFRTMRIRELRGRTFAEQDAPSTQPVAVISRAFAEKFWPGQDPVGRPVHRSGKTATVIGVVDDVKDVDLLQEPEPVYYLPWSQSNTTASPIALIVRTSGDPKQLAGAMRSAVLSVDSNLPLDRVEALESFLAASLAPQRFRASLLSILAAVGLLLGAIGVAGVTARSITERMREFGIRLALGSNQAALWRAAVGRQFRVVLAGSAAGLVLSFAAGRFLASLLPEIGVIDPIATAMACGILMLSALAAASIPALRVLRLDPLLVLRS